MFAQVREKKHVYKTPLEPGATPDILSASSSHCVYMNSFIRFRVKDRFGELSSLTLHAEEIIRELGKASLLTQSQVALYSPFSLCINRHFLSLNRP